MPRVQDPQQKMMSQMMMIMPLFFGYIAITFPTGAVLYWATTSTIGVIQQYFISGWGSLANYLKFLPPDRQSRQPPAAQQAPAQSEEVVGSSGGAAVAAAPRRSFWDVMQPLVEADTAVGVAGGASPQTHTSETREQDAETPGSNDDATSQAVEQARQQATPRKPKPKTSSQSRRGRRRR
jgi:YidC/Oxa1 family membrane protein insertase